MLLHLFSFFFFRFYSQRQELVGLSYISKSKKKKKLNQQRKMRIFGTCAEKSQCYVYFAYICHSRYKHAQTHPETTKNTLIQTYSLFLFFPFLSLTICLSINLS